MWPVSLPEWKLDKGWLKVAKSQISSGFLEIAVQRGNSMGVHGDVSGWQIDLNGVDKDCIRPNQP